MTALTYAIFTDPAALEASAAGRRSRSTGTVYLVITNTARRTDWLKIEVRVPVGDDAGDLTPDLTEMKGEYTDNRWGARPRSQEVKVGRQQGGDVFEVTPQAGGAASFKPGDYMVLTLENVTIASTAGPVVLTVREKTEDDDGEHTRYTSVALLKTSPAEIAAPCGFHPDKGMVGAGENLTLSWEGSPELDYRILFPGGHADIPSGTRTWSPADAPRRATTYTLVATDPVTQKQHFLTTTVQVRHPVLETLTATTGIDTPWVRGAADGEKGRVTFTGRGVEISDNSNRKGTVTADKADLNGVNTGWVQGRSTDDGWISFPKEGLNVRKGAGQAWGSVFADKADLNGVNTAWVQGRSADDGWITFPVEGLKVHRKDDSHLTHLDVGYATHDIVKTRIVRGLRDDDGWISFRKEGLNVHRERGMERGTLFAAETDLKG
ncbi:hypothetical protein [Nonomuraea rhodomycinica]|uniref:Uncharacterized protein n=1 Tax=Nonomuraea rhodomycinica TaxID=1712872 RepID=A0A7Y6IT78_9ACTN|nr:hypothetical protein [Nonomuraea rhodomycinica]NUW43663.1 hypothetical protein [Nonomuraea rhodomycinica]